MNKLLIVLLAVCFVSAHAGLVKRDAPTGEEVQKQFEETSKKLADAAKSFGDQIAKAFEPSNIKDNMNKISEGVTKMMSDIQAAAAKLQPSPAEKPAAQPAA